MVAESDLRAREAPCIRCRGHFELPTLQTARLYELRELVLAKQPIEAIRFIREHSGAGLAEAKGMYQHIVITPMTCHWCRSPIDDAPFVDCPNCRSLNIALPTHPS